MGLLHTLSFIARHPLNRGRAPQAFFRFLSWQVRGRLSGRTSVPWVNGAKLLVGAGEAGLTGNIYCGLHEFEDMAFLLHFLRPEDLFVDVGANAGSYTVLACAAAGAEGIAFEPVPDTFRRLQANVSLNALQARTACHNLCLGDADGAVRFTTDEDCTNHVAAPGEEGGRFLEVPVRRLDDVLGGRRPALMKVDVEGFETPVLRGAERTLAGPSLQAVLLELIGTGARYGFDEEEIRRNMSALGFSPFVYDPFSRTLSPRPEGDGRLNTLYLRDAAEARRRVRAARPFTVLGWTI